MLYGISLSATGAQIERTRMENASNNLANANTKGFKADLLTVMSRPVESETWMTPDQIMRVDYRDELNDRMGGGVWLHQSHSVLEQGAIEQTYNDQHFAIEGEGFFTMQDVHSGEVFYSRAGEFKINSEGILQTADGKYHALDSKGSPINVTQLRESNGKGDFTVDSIGRISINNGTQRVPTNQSLGVLVFEGKDAFELEKWGDGMFSAFDKTIVERATQLADLTGVEGVRAQIHQGALETSGIDPVQAATNMIDVSRSYERHMNMMKMQNGSIEGLMSRVGRAI